MKKIVILKHGGGELANQLWNYVSIYAYGLETSTPVQNPSFFEYHSFFNLLKNESWLTKTRSLFFKTPRRRSHLVNRIARHKYAIQTKIIEILNKKCVISSENTTNTPTYLPPTESDTPIPTNCGTLFFSGWLFRNPAGLIKFRNELINTFSPNKKIKEIVENIISPLRQKYEKVIGIHIRQGDYGVFKNGQYLIDQKRVREIIDEYIVENKLISNKVVFVIASDGPVDEKHFKDLNISISKENSVVDLFLLSKTDAVIGSDSSFGAFASWYGNIPHIILKKEKMDWGYYADKKTHFENKYLTLLPR